MNNYDKLTFFDILSKIKERILDYLFLPYWKIRLGKLGKGSRIKRGVKIIGSGRRIKIGVNFKIWHRCFLNVGTGSINIGSNGHIGVDTYLNSAEGAINIGDNVIISSKVQIFSYSFIIKKDETDKDVIHNDESADVNIKNNIFISSGAIILPGVAINEGAIVGAGAVVIKDVPPYTIVGGIPAKEIRKINH